MVRKARGVSEVLILLMVFIATSLMSCAAESQTISPVSNDTSMTALLASLPEPVERVPVAVYLIQDKTGQNLEMETYTSLSRAVSQGATDMMIHALVLSRQFKVADRSIFDQLMTEQDLQNAAARAERSTAQPAYGFSLHHSRIRHRSGSREPGERA